MNDSTSMHIPVTPPLLDSQPALATIRGVKKSYGLKPVLRGVNLDVAHGERVALLGANGTGKTTLLRLLAGLTRPAAGSIMIAGYTMAQEAQQIRRLVGLVGHRPYLYEELTALENLLFFAKMYAVEQSKERAHALLERVGLERRANERTGTFSRGQLQRLAWARALLHEPLLLLLDEPDTGLDQQGSELISLLMDEHIKHGGSMLFTTHLLENALYLSERVVILRQGRIGEQHASANLNLDELHRVYSGSNL